MRARAWAADIREWVEGASHYTFVRQMRKTLGGIQRNAGFVQAAARLGSTAQLCHGSTLLRARLWDKSHCKYSRWLRAGLPKVPWLMGKYCIQPLP